VIILIGGILVGRLGFREYKNVDVGETVDVPHSNFQIRVDDFTVEFYPGSRAAKEYTSKLTIIEDGVEKLTDTIEVNHPMKYKGVKFYQSSYGAANIVEIQLSKNIPDKNEDKILGNFRIDVGEKFDVPDSQLKIEVVFLVPDFVIDSSGRVGSRSKEMNNPAVFLRLYEGDMLRSGSWHFLKHPDFHGLTESLLFTAGLEHRADLDDKRIPEGIREQFENSEIPLSPDSAVQVREKGDNWLIDDKSNKKIYSVKVDGDRLGIYGKPKYSLKFLSMVYYTGLQISSTPALSVVWIGFLLMVVGMFLSFYLHHKRIWVKLSADGVEIAGRSYKNRASFEREFGRVKALLDEYQ
jgi:cytochrome c biogenesis protein ResB